MVEEQESQVRHLKLQRDDRRKSFLSKKDKTFSQQDKLQSSHHEKIEFLFVTVCYKPFPYREWRSFLSLLICDLISNVKIMHPQHHLEITFSACPFSTVVVQP